MEKLSLSQNNISDISVLEYVNFPKLKELNLSLNLIIDIEVFTKIEFKNIEKLNLLHNKIDIVKNSKIINKIKSIYNSNKDGNTHRNIMI